MKPFLLVLSSPSGGGKSTIARHLLEAREDLGYSISATTRGPRAGEEDGVHYHFLTPEEFDRREAAGEFVESASYGGHRYGTLRSEVDRVLASGRHVVMDIEVQGARQVRQAIPDTVSVFVLPPSGSVLVERLRGRATENEAGLARRLVHAAEELLAATEYDYVVVNDDLVAAVDAVAAILEAEGHRTGRTAGLEDRVRTMSAEVRAARTDVAESSA
ncbi:MAG: guanylate kinase [Gemmatimonadota bacterium]